MFLFKSKSKTDIDDKSLDKSVDNTIANDYDDLKEDHDELTTEASNNISNTKVIMKCCNNTINIDDLFNRTLCPKCNTLYDFHVVSRNDDDTISDTYTDTYTDTDSAINNNNNNNNNKNKLNIGIMKNIIIENICNSAFLSTIVPPICVVGLVSSCYLFTYIQLYMI